MPTKRSKDPTSFYLLPEVRAAMRLAAEIEGCSLSSFVEGAIMQRAGAAALTPFVNAQELTNALQRAEEAIRRTAMKFRRPE